MKTMKMICMRRNCSVLARLKVIIFHKSSTSKAARILKWQIITILSRNYLSNNMKIRCHLRLPPLLPLCHPGFPSDMLFQSVKYVYDKMCQWKIFISTWKESFYQLCRFTTWTQILSEFSLGIWIWIGIIRNLSRARSEFLPWREISRKSLLGHCVTNATKQTSICDVLCHNHH